MKLISFVASDVFDFLQFKIVFNEDLSLLTGSNGSGKTTIIRLLQALLTASVKELNLIQFRTAELVIDHSNKKITITAKYAEDTIDISVSGISDVLHVPKIDPEEIERRNTEVPRGEDLFGEITVKISTTEVFKFLSSLESPVILGLERRSQVAQLTSDRERYLTRMSYSSRRRIIRGTLGISLTETQQMVQDAYRKIREFQDRQNQTLREDILLSMFNYTTSESVLPGKEEEMPSWQNQLQIIKRKREIESSLAGMVASKDRLSSAVEDFFRRVEGLFKQMEKHKKGGIDLDWLINKAQIDRIVSIAEIVDKHRTSMDEFMMPLNLFKDTINGFYADSRKTIDIDPVGFLFVNRQDGKTTSVEALSSGERQLLIIFAHLMFNRYSGKSNVFIIDEPELSLHLKWQGMFVEQISKLSPNTQFILATHSPEIVGEFETKCIPIVGVQK